MGQDDVLAEAHERVDEPVLGGEESFSIQRARRVRDHHYPLRRVAARHVLLLLLQLRQEVEPRQGSPLALAEIRSGLGTTTTGVRLAIGCSPLA